jgi:fused signal recognition particle receptor
MSAMATTALDGAEVDRAVEEVASPISTVVAIAQRLDVTDAGSAQQATELLTRIAGQAKAAETARVELVRPLNDHVRTINARFREAAEPLAQAREIVSKKLLAYQAEQERLRAAEQARIDAERRAAEETAAEARRQEEAAARAASEAAAREAARKQAEAERTERERLAAIAREQDERKRRVAMMSDDELARCRAEGGPDAQLAYAELAVRKRAREAQEAAAAARQREEEARAAEQVVRGTPLPVAAPTQAAPVAKLAAPSGAAQVRKVWKHEVLDVDAVPREYLVVDERAIRQAIRDGVRAIPGVRIEQVSELAVRAA